MRTTKQIGDAGEEIARRHLVGAGYRIVETNWRFGKLEIDIVAELPDTMVFVEVKLRQTDEYGEPETFVSRKKAGFAGEGGQRVPHKPQYQPGGPVRRDLHNRK